MSRQSLGKRRVARRTSYRGLWGGCWRTRRQLKVFARRRGVRLKVQHVQIRPFFDHSLHFSFTSPINSISHHVLRSAGSHKNLPITLYTQAKSSPTILPTSRILQKTYHRCVRSLSTIPLILPIPVTITSLRKHHTTNLPQPIRSPDHPSANPNYTRPTPVLAHSTTQNSAPPQTAPRPKPRDIGIWHRTTCTPGYTAPNALVRRRVVQVLFRGFYAPLFCSWLLGGGCVVWVVSVSSSLCMGRFVRG